MAYDFEENVIGGVCIGTVVRNYTGRPVAAMSISTPTQRLRGEKLITFKGHLLEALYRDVRAPRIYEGASDIQRLVIGRNLA